jgi:hypothetical protein
MKRYRSLPFFVLLAAMTGLAACGNITIPSLVTATARAAGTATAAAGKDYETESGLRIGSSERTEQALAENTPLLEALAEEQYESSELSQAGQAYPYTITLEEEQTLIWQNGWCTTTEALLDQNLEQIRIRFLVEDEMIDPGHILAVKTRNDDLYCAIFLISVYGWPAGTTRLQVDVAFLEKINDGIADYPEGTHSYQYEVTLK